MKIHTDHLRTRKMADYIAIYGTDDNAGDYDILGRDEALAMAVKLREAADGIMAEADRLASLAESLPTTP